MTFVRRNIQPAPGVWDWRQTDALVGAYETSHLKILAILSTAPQWMGSNANGTRPVDIAYWRLFVREVAERYASRVHAYEIWNEPDIYDAGTGVGWAWPLWGPPAYADFVAAAAQEIHEHAPGTLVVGPVSRSEVTSSTVELFRSLEEYDVGGGRNAASYNQSSATVWGWMDSHLSTLKGRNPSNWEKPIFVTEIGWKSSRVGEAGQRDRIRELVRRLTYEFCQICYPTSCDFPRTFLAFIDKETDTPIESFGIYRQDGIAKPVVTGYTKTLPTVGIHPASGWNTEGYRPFSVECNLYQTCTLTSGYPAASWRLFDWDFGDRSTATGRTVTHTYSAAGTYFIYHGALGVLEWPSDDRMLIIQSSFDSP